jgi:hypothetical protein
MMSDDALPRCDGEHAMAMLVGVSIRHLHDCDGCFE